MNALANFPVNLKFWCELFLAADYFRLEDLMKTILARQSDFLSGIAKHIQLQSDPFNAPRGKRPEDFLTSASLDAFFDVVAFAYRHDLVTIEPYKKTLCTFLRQIHHFVVLDARFKEHLKKAPQFGADLFCEHVFDRPQGGSMISTSLPDLCYSCGAEFKFNGLDDWLANKPTGPIETHAQDNKYYDDYYEKIISVRGHCMKCTEMLRGKAN
jgi:hypothetical protein